MKLRVFMRCIGRRNFLFARKLLADTVRGMTHWNCKRCGKYKGLSFYSLCAGCQLDKIMSALAQPTKESE
jgi:hypothetical protein